VSEFGRLDVMVTNGGVLRDKVLCKMSDEDFDLVVHTHLRGTFTCARAAAIRMREQGGGGLIIVVGSPAGQFGNFGQSNYAAAKAGIVALARTWALELARAGITVNAAEIVHELRDGGWTADGIAAAWSETFARAAQPCGVRLPELELS
jgi:NAD(P)-dependent dehydrogenase (short-subunit alcohol dehydrogenase family)